jgi:hypothetical protein
MPLPPRRLAPMARRLVAQSADRTAIRRRVGADVHGVTQLPRYGVAIVPNEAL